MKLLKELNSTETLFLMNPNKVSLKDLLKYTLIDLVYKGVLEIKIVSRKSHPSDKYVRNYVYVKRGVNFENYKSLSYERRFLKYFDDEYFEKMQIRSYLKAIHKGIDSDVDFKSEIQESENLKKYFGSFKINLFGLYSYFIRTNDGFKKSEIIDRELKRLEKIIKNPKDHVSDDLAACLLVGANILLIEDFDQELLNNFHEFISLNSVDSNLGNIDIDLLFTSLNAITYKNVGIYFSAGCSSGGCVSAGCGGCSGCGGCGG
ncbi:hypothetical protein [Aureivirga sp. CE67]|uniref:hypothetical protein n=1 Tax=Aureivirga sp. CE67 TaxID=1788983 RepID=UPI0018CA39F0|nr:hypothetical protein [Aureivirga sp. CE67]